MLRTVITISLVAWAGPALAVEGALLSIRNFSPNNADLSYSDYAGPITISQTNRSGSVRGTVDYGHARAFGTQRMMSLVDGKSTSASRVTSTWFDRFDLQLAGVSNLVDLGFWIDVAAPAPKQTTKGYRGAEAYTSAEWYLEFGTEALFGGAGRLRGIVAGSRTTTDTPLGPPTTSAELDTLFIGAEPTSFFAIIPSVVSVASVRPGFDRYLVKAQFRPGRQYDVIGFANCTSVLTSFRIGDSASGSCGNSVMEWGGLAGIFDFNTGEAIEGASATFDSVSGYDYNQPYTPPAASAFRQSVAAAVPEPATWAMVIAGFGSVGAAARRRRMVPT